MVKIESRLFCLFLHWTVASYVPVAFIVSGSLVIVGCAALMISAGLATWYAITQYMGEAGFFCGLTFTGVAYVFKDLLMLQIISIVDGSSLHEVASKVATTFLSPFRPLRPLSFWSFINAKSGAVRRRLKVGNNVPN